MKTKSQGEEPGMKAFWIVVVALAGSATKRSTPEIAFNQNPVHMMGKARDRRPSGMASPSANTRGFDE